MSFRLYESAWVQVEGVDQPVQVFKDRQAGVFLVGDHRYDIDARPMASDASAPKLIRLLSIQAMREAGLSANYGGGGV